MMDYVIKVEHNSLPLKSGLHIMTSFQRRQYGKGEKRATLWSRNMTNTTSVRWSRSTSTVVSHIHRLYPWYDMIRMAFCLFGFCLQNSSLIMRKISDKSHLRYILQNTWAVFLKTVEVIKNKDSLRNCNSQKEPKEITQLSVTWYPGRGPGTEKGHYIKSKKIWIKYELQLMLIY